MKDFIEVKKGSSTIEIMEADSYGFADIIINKDSIIIQSLPTIIYKLKGKAFNYTIKLDTTITEDYWRQKVEEREKLKKSGI